MRIWDLFIKCAIICIYYKTHNLKIGLKPDKKKKGLCGCFFILYIRKWWKAMIQIYKSKEADSLNDLRLKCFYSKVTDSKTAIHPRHPHMPSTSSSAMLHSFRVYHQVREWMGNLLPPEEWSWNGCGTLCRIHFQQTSLNKDWGAGSWFMGLLVYDSGGY